MHREISHTDDAFHQHSNLSLYVLTGLVGLLIGIDLAPVVLGWFEIPWPLPREVFGPYRFALLAAIVGGARTLYSSIEALLEGRLGADLAIAIAVIAAILIGEPLVAAEVVFIGMLGECLESITFARTQRAIQKIVEVCPRRCWLLKDGQEIRVLTAEVQVGDTVVVKPGARVPVDGVVIAGKSAVDTSALTGESLPVDKVPGDEALAGSLNQFGALTIEARRVAEQTVVGRVIELTAKALKDKAPLERTADRLARYFLPVVLALAALTFLVCMAWYWGPLKARMEFWPAVRMSVYPTLAVLVVACPCALILATPAAVIAALGRLAGTGVLIKGGSALERLAQVSRIAFDKTGTLTEGKLELGQVIAFRGIQGDELIRIAAVAEQQSEHPIAQLIVAQARQRNLPLESLAEFQAHPGAGVTARAGGVTITVGNRRLLEERKIPLPPPVLAILDKLDAAGETPLLVALEDQPIGVIGARDRVRPEAAAAIVALREAGITDMAVLTGDRAAVARAVAETVGINDVHAELLPIQKAEFLDQWKGSQAKPAELAPWYSLTSGPATLAAFVGDGINDAPALAKADVGIAIGSGSDVAAETGDIVLMGEPLEALPLLLRLSRQTVHIIRQNIIIFAFIVNGLGILLTAWLWPIVFPFWHEQAPLAAVVYHQIGSLAVLLNAMRLLWFERKAASPAWLRTKDVVTRLDLWMQHLSLDEGLHWVSHEWRRVLAGVAGLLIALFAISGFTRVGPDEVAVARVLGKPTATDLGPGLHWSWPWPVGAVTRIKPDQVRTVEIGYRVLRKLEGMPQELTWASGHQGGGQVPQREEAVMITGDGNLVELQATVRYTIADPRTYLFDASRSDQEFQELLRSATEAILREAISAQPFFDLLTTSREALQEQVQDRLTARCNDYGLGIRIDGVSLSDLHPPGEVVSSYHDVARAMEDRDRLINEAQARALKAERAAESEALEMVRGAEEAATRKEKEAEAARDGFLARLAGRRELTRDEEEELKRAAAAAVADPSNVEAVNQEYQRRRRDRIAVNAFLTDFRMTLAMLAKVLGGRNKVIIDSDKVPGKRHLMMVDPDWFRPPPPVFLPGDRQPPRRGMDEGP